jgi:hypothetical protein
MDSGSEPRQRRKRKLSEWAFPWRLPTLVLGVAHFFELAQRLPSIEATKCATRSDPPLQSDRFVVCLCWLLCLYLTYTWGKATGKGGWALVGLG